MFIEHMKLLRNSILEQDFSTYEISTLLASILILVKKHVSGKQSQDFIEETERLLEAYNKKLEKAFE